MSITVYSHGSSCGEEVQDFAAVDEMIHGKSVTSSFQAAIN